MAATLGAAFVLCGCGKKEGETGPDARAAKTPAPQRRETPPPEPESPSDRELRELDAARPPKPSPAVPRPLELRVTLGETSVEVTGTGIETSSLPRGDMEALTKLAASLKIARPWDYEVVVAAHETIPIAELVDTMDALRGECEAGVKVPGCLFPHVVIDAH